MTNNEIQNKVASLLSTKGWANVRSGELRSTDAARKLLRAGAKQAGVEVSITSEDGFVSAKVK